MTQSRHDTVIESWARFISGWCETCGRIFYGRSPGKLCDVPTCRGYVRHV